MGIELSDALATRAAANIRSLGPPKAPAEVRVIDAAFADYAEGTAFYLFNPFGRETMGGVLSRIPPPTARNPRPVRIIYVNPFHDDVFEAAGWLRRVRSVRSVWSKTYATYWISDPS